MTYPEIVMKLSMMVVRFTDFMMVGRYTILIAEVLPIHPITTAKPLITMTLTMQVKIKRH